MHTSFTIIKVFHYMSASSFNSCK